MSSSEVNLEKFLIPLDEILLATQNFSEANLIERGTFGEVYKGKLSERWGNCTASFRRLHSRHVNWIFLMEVEVMSRINHENVTAFIGYCNESQEMIQVSQYANKGRLDYYLLDHYRRRFLSWAQRLEICIGVARGLQYLQGLGENSSVLHDHMKSANILLDQKLEAKISNSGLTHIRNEPQVHKCAARFLGRPDAQNMPENKPNLPPSYSSSVRHINRSQDQTQAHVSFGELPPSLGRLENSSGRAFRFAAAQRHEAETKFHLDPIYKESGDLNTSSNVYSFGIILFEMLSGVPAYLERLIGDDVQPQRLISLVRCYSQDDGGDNLVDPLIKDQINNHSLLAFTKIAYQCISWKLKDRADVSTIINKIQEALDFQKQEEASINITRSLQPQNLKGFLIPLDEIMLATNEFSWRNLIGHGTFGAVYVGQLSKYHRTAAIKRLDRHNYGGVDKFHNHLQMISSFNHQNVITFLGYCDEGNEKIIVYDYAINKSIDCYIQDRDMMRRLTWIQRLRICLGAARGLKYLHWDLQGDKRLIHRDVKCANILLDDNMEAKICDFGLSLLVDKNQPQVYVPPAGTDYYMDPVYGESGILKIEADVFSFGVVMLEILSGTMAHQKWSTDDIYKSQALVNLVRSYYDDEPDILIDPFIIDEVDIRSFHVFMNIAYQSISYNLKDRPTMKRIVRRIEEALKIQANGAASTIVTRSRQQDLKSFQIPLTEINYILEDRIGDGGFGKVYKGQVSKRLPKCIVAIKCLDPESHQGEEEFLTEVRLISSFDHPNIIHFVGYCDEDGQMIIISKYAIHGSLDQHLLYENKRRCLTWIKRLKICLGAAKGLNYLHTGLGKNNKVIHRDIKSANILLDENMEAKICDFGLSRKDQQDAQVYTRVVGTNFYTDPIYRERNTLGKESDVYSFGVVLFEMLSGKLAYGRQPVITLVRRYYKNESNKLKDPLISDQIDDRCFNTFKELAYACISLKPEERPTMDTVIDRIEDAIDFQEGVEG